MTAVSPWLSLACGNITPVSASFFTWPLTHYVSVSTFLSSYKDISHWFRAHLDPGWPRFNLVPSTKTLFPNKIACIGSRWIWTSAGGTIQSHTTFRSHEVKYMQMTINSISISIGGKVAGGGEEQTGVRQWRVVEANGISANVWRIADYSNTAPCCIWPSGCLKLNILTPI